MSASQSHVEVLWLLFIRGHHLANAIPTQHLLQIILLTLSKKCVVVTSLPIYLSDVSDSWSTIYSINSKRLFKILLSGVVILVAVA